MSANVGRIRTPSGNEVASVAASLAAQFNEVVGRIEPFLGTLVVHEAPDNRAETDVAPQGETRLYRSMRPDGTVDLNVYHALIDNANGTAVHRWWKSWVRPVTETATDKDLWAYDSDVSQWYPQSASSLGIVSGPSSSTDNAIARWDGTGGTLLQNSGVIIDDTDNVTGMATLTLPNTGLHLLDTDASHDLIIAPGTNLTADRTVTLTTPDAALTLNLSTVTAGRIFRADGTNWLASTATYPDTVTVNRILYASSENVVSDLATANSAVLVTSGAGVPSLATDIPTAVTIGGAYIYRVGGTDVGTTDGGTGVSTLTLNGVLYGNGTGNVLVTAQGAANSVLTANAGAPSFSATPTVTSLTATTTVTAARAVISGTTSRMIDVNWNTTGGFVFMSFRNQNTEKWWIRSDDTSHDWSITNASSQYAISVSSARRVGLGIAAPNLLAQCHVLEPTVGNAVWMLQSTATNDDPNLTVTQGRAATTNATVTTLQTIAITASRTYQIEARVSARRTGGVAGTADDGASYVIHGSYTTKAGTVTLLGALSATYTAEDQAAWDATLTISGANVLVRVTGAADNNITWHSTTYVSYVGS